MLCSDGRHGLWVLRVVSVEGAFSPASRIQAAWEARGQRPRPRESGFQAWLSGTSAQASLGHLFPLRLCWPFRTWAPTPLPCQLFIVEARLAGPGLPRQSPALTSVPLIRFPRGMAVTCLRGRPTRRGFRGAGAEPHFADSRARVGAQGNVCQMMVGGWVQTSPLAPG